MAFKEPLILFLRFPFIAPRPVLRLSRPPPKSALNSLASKVSARCNGLTTFGCVKLGLYGVYILPCSSSPILKDNEIKLPLYR